MYPFLMLFDILLAL